MRNHKFLIFFHFLQPLAASSRQTVYDCDGQSTNITCHDSVLNIIGAFFGRRDLLHCPGQTSQFTKQCGIDITTPLKSV